MVRAAHLRLILQTTVWLGLAGAAHAEGDAVSRCADIADGAARLICYDAVGKAIGTPAKPAAPPADATRPAAADTSPSPSPAASGAKPADAPEATATKPSDVPEAVEPHEATTKEILSAIPADGFKAVDPADLHVAPRKFLGKPIELRHLHCYYADVGDYRCIAPGFAVVTVFTPAIQPDPEKQRIEDDCGAMKAMNTAKCERTLHFVLDDFDEDQPNALTTRVILRPKAAIVVVPAKKKR